MADTTTRDITTDILLADLVTAITGSQVKLGTYYNVTDKGWYLLAIASNKLIPVSGVLTLTNGDTLPEGPTPGTLGIEPERLLIDTGVIDYDISEATGTPINAPLVSGYEFPVSVYAAKIAGENTIGSVSAYMGFFTYDPDISTGDSAKLLLQSTGLPKSGTSVIDIKATGVSATDTARFIAEFTKSPL